MNHFKIIQDKLEQFIKRYYSNELIKGAILFFSIGLLYLLITLFIEYVLWLEPVARGILFWLFVIVETVLFVRFIIWPVLQLLNLKNGIDQEDASKIIGKHFPEVNDKLLNLLQLHRNREQSELLIAGIEQKSAELRPVPFKLAVNFKSNLKYLKYAAFPVSVLLLSYAFGHFNWFSDSYTRVVNYKTAYEPPAPFEFFVLNEHLETIENQEFKLQVKTVGNVVPENVQIHFDGQTYFLSQIHRGSFEYVFPQLKAGVSFYLSANNWRSKPYRIEVIPIPALVNFEMELAYPSYLGRTNETLKSTGNTTVPEGTKVTWNLITRATDKVMMYAKDTVAFNPVIQGDFQLSKPVFSRFDYAIATSNQVLKDYEHLTYSIEVVKDAFPELLVRMVRDSVDLQTLYFYGQAGDDYGLSKLQLVYYPADGDQDGQKVPIAIGQSTFEEFITAFPNNLELEPGVAYELYFQVFDNDALHNYKSVKSNIFTYRKLTAIEEEHNQLKDQGETIKNLDKSLENLKSQEKHLEELSRTQKEKEQLNFSDRRRLENFIKRQKQQEEMMQNFNKRLHDNLENFQKDEPQTDQFKEELTQRLRDNEAQLKKDEQLLKELEDLQNKIKREELTDRLEQLARQNKNKQKSLQQLLELTKRYYVAKKAEKLQRQLEQLAKDQEQLSKEDARTNTTSKQDLLNEAFDEFQKELDALQKENEDLKQPLDIPRDVGNEDAIKNDQQQASDRLNKSEDSRKHGKDSNADQELKDAKQKQQDAGRKMKELSAKIMQSMMMSGQNQLQEDAAMLRQILKNLLVFSFDQEDLMEQFKSIQINHNKYGSYLRRQSNLREHFEHVDDSLFALSMRQPRLSEHINSKITDVYFYIDKGMDELSENLLYQGVASQQYVMTAANDLASFLSDVLDNMESQLNPSAGAGSGNDDKDQLPDIIMSQEALNQQMQDGLNKSEGKDSDGEDSQGDDGSKEDGQDSENDGDSQDNGSEFMNGELYDIYQKQQRLRQALEDELRERGLSLQGQQVLRQMEQVEFELINRGFTHQTLQRMMQLQQQLLRLENATYLQEEDQRREATTNIKDFENPLSDLEPKAKEYFNTTEILNRQALPLQNIFRRKVQEYFKQEDD